MDDVVGFIAERIAGRIRSLREADADRRRIAEAIAAPPPPALGRRATAPPVSRAATPRASRIDLDDAFPTTLDVVAPTRTAHTNGLLAAFAGGSSLLGALVLSEALAPPVALRGGPPHRPLR